MQTDQPAATSASSSTRALASVRSISRPPSLLASAAASSTRISFPIAVAAAQRATVCCLGAAPSSLMRAGGSAAAALSHAELEAQQQVLAKQPCMLGMPESALKPPHTAASTAQLHGPCQEGSHLQRLQQPCAGRCLSQGQRRLWRPRQLRWWHLLQKVEL